MFDEDKLKQDKRLGIAKLPLNDLEMESVQEINLQLLSSLDTTKVKDKKDRGVLTIKVSSCPHGGASWVLGTRDAKVFDADRRDNTQVLYHPFTKAEALEALELEKKTVEERRKTKEETAAVSGAADAASGVTSTVTPAAGAGVAAEPPRPEQAPPPPAPAWGWSARASAPWAAASERSAPASARLASSSAGPSLARSAAPGAAPAACPPLTNKFPEIGSLVHH